MFWLATWKVRFGFAADFRAFGSSMEPVIPSGSMVTIEPVDVERIELGDIVVARVGGSTMLHLVKTIDASRRQVEISGTSGSADGWTVFERDLHSNRLDTVGRPALGGLRIRCLGRS